MNLPMLTLMNNEVLEGRIIMGIGTIERRNEYPVNQYSINIIPEQDCNNRTIIIHLISIASTDEQFDKIITIMKEKNESAFNGDCVILVEHPMQLAKYLTISCITIDDLVEMLSRCIETNNDWNELSFNILIIELEAFFIDAVCDLRLLKISNHNLYIRAKQHNLQDLCYEAQLFGQSYSYSYQSPIAMFQQELKVTYRYIYHILMYGDIAQRQEIYVYVDFTHSIEALNAICDFYKLPRNSSVQLVKDTIAIHI